MVTIPFLQINNVNFYLIDVLSDNLCIINSNKILVEEIIEEPRLFQLKDINNCITDKLAEAQDWCKMGDRDAFRISHANAEYLVSMN